MCANEADMGCAVDQTLSKVLYKSSGLEPKVWETTQHDVRWGDHFSGRGSVRWQETGCRGIHLGVRAFGQHSRRTHGTRLGRYGSGPSALRIFPPRVESAPRAWPGMVNLSGAGFISMRGVLSIDLGRGGAVTLPPEESTRRWKATTEEWPLMHAILYGVSPRPS